MTIGIHKASRKLQTRKAKFDLLKRQSSTLLCNTRAKSLMILYKFNTLILYICKKRFCNEENYLKLNLTIVSYNRSLKKTPLAL